MSSPLFSIVIPTYNRAHTVTRAIHSCLMQTCQDFEIIIVDDAKSTDDIQTAVNAFQDPRIRLKTGCRGTAATARNRGIELAKGHYIALLDSDDEFLPAKLETYKNRLETASDMTVLFSQSYVDRGVGKLWIKPDRGLDADERIWEYLFLGRGWIHTSTVVVEAGLAKSTPYKEDLKFGDDCQLAIDLWKKGARFVMIEEPLALYEDTTESAPTRLSQTLVFVAGDAEEHQVYREWVESQKPHMSEQAYRAANAYFISRLIASASPLQALRAIIAAYREGGLSATGAGRQAIQTFTPHLYRRLANLVVMWRGIEPPASVRRLRDVKVEKTTQTAVGKMSSLASKSSQPV